MGNPILHLSHVSSFWKKVDLLPQNPKNKIGKKGRVQNPKLISLPFANLLKN